MADSPFVELEVGKRTVKVTNPDKVFFRKRKETKLDLVQYYLSVGDGIVRALYERPTQLKRHPDGAEGEAIYQKRVPEKRPEWIETATVTFPSGRTADELCVTELAHVAWAANLGTLDFHPWPSRRRDVEHPDELRIDIDAELVRVLDVSPPRRPGVKVDGCEIRGPRDLCELGDAELVGSATGRERHGRGLDPLGSVFRHALLVDRLPLGAVRVPLELRRPLVEHAHNAVANREVVLDEVELRLAARAEEDLVRVRHLD